MTEALAPQGGRQTFIYWRVPQEQLDAAVLVLQAWQQTCMRDTPGLVARLYLRAAADGSDAVATVMETYAGARPGTASDERCHEHLRVAGDAVSAAFRIGPRHVEIFDECAPLQSTKRPPSSRS